MEEASFNKVNFFLTHQGKAVMTTRRTTEPGSVLEFDLVGGKVQESETDYQAAFAELVEELGMNVLNQDWSERTINLPDGKRELILLELEEDEFARLPLADETLSDWKRGITRSFENITGRKEAAHKETEEICLVDVKELVAYVEKFQKGHLTAKLFRKHHQIKGHGVRRKTLHKRGLRPSILELLVELLELIVKIITK